jgi:murein L,D-transpeptidase YafK
MACLLGLLMYTLRAEKPLPQNAKISKIVVLKSERKLVVFENGSELKTYKISLGFQPIGPKRFEGDGKTPEGNYIINDKNPNSAYHLNLGISYPNSNDIALAKTNEKSAGGDIKIHGLKNGTLNVGKLHRFKDWTAGCIALTNAEIEELYRVVEIGTPIEIKK